MVDTGMYCTRMVVPRSSQYRRSPRLDTGRPSTKHMNIYTSRPHRSDSDLNGPDPGASPYVENSSRLFANRCKMVFVAHYYANHLMCDVKAIQFALRTALAGDIQWCN